MYNDLFQTERRAHKRVKAIFAAILTNYESTTVSYASNSANISEGGMRVVTAKEIVPGEERLISFSLPGYDAMLSIKVVVIWQRPHINYYEAGIRFREINDRDKRLIQEYIKNHITEAA